jgi:hypothetical protein
MVSILNYLVWHYTVTWRLKAGIVQPEESSIAIQRLGKQVSAATDTQATIEELLRTTFSVRSVQSGYKEDFVWESAFEFRSSKWAVSRKLSSARKAEKMALWVRLGVGLWREDFTCTVVQWYLEHVIQWDCCSSCLIIRFRETDSGDCNKLRTLMCVTMNCKVLK